MLKLMQGILRSIAPMREKAFATIKSNLQGAIHHERTKKFFDHNSPTAWKGAMAACFVTVLLVWYPFGYLAAVIEYCVRGPLGDFLFETIYNSIFREESELVPGMFTDKQGDFYEFAAEPVRVFLFSLIDSIDLVVIAIAMYLFRKRLRVGLLNLTAKLPEHFRAYSIVITTTAVFAFGWAAVRSPYPFIFGIIWNILFPALVGILTWFTIREKDFLIDKSKIILEIREKIPVKFRILYLFGFTLVLTYILMAFMPNKGTQFKEQLIVLISVFLGWLLSVEYTSQRAKGQNPTKTLVSSLAIAIFFIIVIAPLGVADPSECCHPHDELEADRFFPGEIYPTTQGTIIGIFGCGIGLNIRLLNKPRGSEEETEWGDSPHSESDIDPEEESGFISILADTWKGIRKELSEASDQIVDFTEEASNIIRDGQFWIDTVTGSLETIYDTSDRLVNKTSSDDVVAGTKKVGNTIIQIGEYAMDKPVEFLLSLTPVEALENSFDPNKTLIERMGNLTIVYLEGVGAVLSGGTVGGVKAGGKILILGENIEDAKDLQKMLSEKNDLGSDDIKIGKTVKSVKGGKLKDVKHKIAPRKELTEEVIEQRKGDWQTSLAKADSRVKEYVEALNTEPIDYDRVDKAMIELKRDKIGMNLANKDLTDSQKQIFNQRTDDLHMKVDTEVKEFAKEQFNLGDMKGPVKTSEGKVWTNPETKEQFIAVETTNPTTVVKIGSDRDITYRVVKLDDNGQLVKSDIDHRFVRTKYEESYHKNSRATELGYEETPGEFTYNSDQANTSMRHEEAFGRSIKEGENIVLRKDLSDDSQLRSDTSSFKHDHWWNKGTPGSEFEGLRNLSKLRKSQHEPLVNELRELNPDHHLLKERAVDGNMVQKMGTRRTGHILEEIRKLSEDPRNCKSPVEIEKMVRDEGFANMNEFSRHVTNETATYEEAVRYHRRLKND